MLAAASKTSFDTYSFQELPKPNLSQLRSTPEQQQTPTASPIMEKADLKQDLTRKEQQKQQGQPEKEIEEEEEEEEEENATTREQSTSPPIDQTRSSSANLQNILGLSFSSWPYSESSLIHAINLKLEQEKTKQEYYKLETTNRMLELMKHSILARVPADLIPLIFAGQNMNTESIELLLKVKNAPPQSQLQQSKLQPQQMVNLQNLKPQPQPQPQQEQQQEQQQPIFNLHTLQPPTSEFQQLSPYHTPLHQSNPFRSHQRSQTMGIPTEFQKKQSTERDEFSTPPMPTSFKFGGDKSELTTPSSVQQNPPTNQTLMETPPRNRPRPSRRLSPAKIGAQAVASLNHRFKSNVLQQHHIRTTSLPPQVSIPESEALAFHREEKKLPKLPLCKTPTPNNKPIILQHQLIQFHHWTPGEAESTPNKRRRSDDATEDKSISMLKDDNNHERRKFITTHGRTRSDSSLLFQDDISKKGQKSSLPKYPNILSNDGD